MRGRMTIEFLYENHDQREQFRAGLVVGGLMELRTLRCVRDLWRAEGA